MAKQPQKIRLNLSPQAERYARPDAPRDARLMAARGALPLPPVDLATVLFALVHDPDPEVKSTAHESLESLPDSVCDTVLSGPAHPALLSHLAHTHRDDEDRLEKIALNPRTDDATLAFLASLPFKKLVDILSNNQQRMLEAPEIVDALGANPLTGRAVIERILTFLGIDPVGEDNDVAPAPTEVSDEEAEAALRAVLGEDFAGTVGALVSEGDENPTDKDNIFTLIQKMSVFQKIKLARLGNKEARSMLVRDRNKIVAQAALTNPKTTDSEIVAIAQSRNVGEEIMRLIARNRDWTRNYQIKLALSTNPKCPQVTAIKFVNYLQERDLRQIMRSRDVPRAVANPARRILSKKGKI